MCGLGGYVNIPDHATRERLTLALGCSVDTRGGHAAGYVSVTSRPPQEGRAHVNYGRKVGTWGHASRGFVADCARGDLAIVHARYATCGKRDDARQAHPYAIRRVVDGRERTLLWGAHNGMLDGSDGAQASAKLHGRAYTVDSREAFELLADGELDALRALQGYGVLTWIAGDARDRVRLVRLSDDAELVIGRTACDAGVWASTRKILDVALAYAGLELAQVYETDAPGRVLEAHADGRVTYSEAYPDPIKVAPRVYPVGRQWDWHPATDRKASGWDAAADVDDGWEIDPGDCPACGSYDTWQCAHDTGECAECGANWTLVRIAVDADVPPCETGETGDVANEDAWDEQAWERWLADFRLRDRMGRTSGRTATSTVDAPPDGAE